LAHGLDRDHPEQHRAIRKEGLKALVDRGELAAPERDDVGGAPGDDTDVGQTSPPARMD
jgi:hypothetical protein